MSCAAGRGEDVCQHECAADRDCFDVVDVETLALGDVRPAQRDVLGPFAKAVLFAKSYGGLAVFVDDCGLVLNESQFLAELAEEDCFLSGGAEADKLGFSSVEDLKGSASGAPRDGSVVQHEDVAGRAEAFGFNVGEARVCVAVDVAGLVRSAAGSCGPANWNVLSSLQVSKNFLGCCHVRIAGFDHVASELRSDPADFRDSVNLKIEELADEFLVLFPQVWIDGFDGKRKLVEEGIGLARERGR